MASTARAISSGLVPRPSGIEAACRSNCSGVWRGLGSAGPGPMPLTRMRGASASAIDCVSAHRPALATV